jgi:glucoamylase
MTVPIRPSAAPSSSAPRAPHLPTAVLGDGALLVVLGPEGDLQQAWWPHPDRHVTVRRFALGIAGDHSLRGSVAGGSPAGTSDDLADVRWASTATCDQHGESDAGVVRTNLAFDGAPHLELVDVVATSGPALVRRVTASHPVELVLRVELPAESMARLAAPHGAGTPMLEMRLADDRAAVVAIDAPGTVAIDADGATLTARVEHAATIVLALAANAEGAAVLARDVLTAGHAAAFADRRAVDAALLAQRTPTLIDGDLDALDRASVRVLTMLTDRGTGGTIAGPECDPSHVRSGGYGYVWPRDLAFILLADLAAGLHAAVRGAVDWFVRAQSTDGLWEQRHHTDGSEAPGWGRQLDETGATLFAIAEAARVLGDRDLADRAWPAVAAGADALASTLDPVTGLPAPSFDPWEERFGVHTFTAAATVAGLEAAATFADARDPKRAAAWRAAAARVRDGIDRWLWSPDDGRFLRSRDVGRRDDAGSAVPPGYLRAARPEWEVRSVDPVDATVDVSLAGLVHPFGVLAHDDPRVVATLDAIDAHITSARGAVGRYVGDTYVGGNPWVLAGLWVGLARRAPGATHPAGGVDLALAVASSTWLLPEQFDADTLEPRWILPLAWSHAMLMLAVRRCSPSSPASAAASARPVTPNSR